MMGRRTVSQITSGPGYGLALHLSDLAAQPVESIVGSLAQQHANAGSLELTSDAIRAWSSSLARLSNLARDLIVTSPQVANWGVVLEFDVPRRNKRIDAVLITGSALIVIEFKSASAPTAGHGKW